MQTMTLGEFKAALIGQGVPSHEHFALKCPICGTVQSAKDLIRAGAGQTFDDVEKYLGFSCVGRFTGAGAHQPGEPPGRGCNWTLGGLFQLHKLEVVTEDGKHHPRFELATADEAQAHMRANAEVSAPPGGNMNEDQISRLTLDMLGDLMRKLPTKREKSDALGTLMLAAYNLLRTTEGDEFVRGWLESALADIAANPPACEFREPH